MAERGLEGKRTNKHQRFHQTRTKEQAGFGTGDRSIGVS
jgi:hypothetical protein